MRFELFGKAAIILATLLLVVHTTLAEKDSSPFRVSQIDQQTLINEYIQVFHTPEQLNSNNVLELIVNGEIDQTGEVLNPGMSSPEDHYWILCEVINDQTDESELYFEIDYPQLDVIELFNSNTPETELMYKSGDNLSFDNRPILTRNYVFPITLPPNDTLKLLIHLEKFKSAMRFPIYVYSPKDYTASHFKSNLFYSFYFGIILLIALASLILGIVIKHKTFVIYCLYLLTFGLWLFTRLGYSYQFFIPNNPELNRHLLPVVGQLAIMALIIYVRSFFNTRDTLPFFHKVMTGVLAFFCVGYLFWGLFPDSFVEYATKLFVIRYLLFTTTIIFTITAAINYRKIEKYRSSMFLLAYSLFLGAILSKIIAEYGVINEFTLQYDPIMIGFIIEVAVLSTAMVVILNRKIAHSESLEVANEILVKTVDQYKKQSTNERNGYVVLNSKATLNLDEIIYIKADGHYLEFYLSNGKKELDRNSISHALKILTTQFVQSHRSYIINLDQVKVSYSDKFIMNNGDEVKLSRTYKAKVQSVLNKLKNN